MENKKGRIFITSDVHGCLDELLKGLNLIKFNSNDILYVLGDANDKGPKSLETIDYIRNKKNIIHIKGNHEYAIERSIEGDIRIPNKKQILKEVEERNIIDSGYKESLYRYIKGLPYYIIEGDFLLIHGGIDINIEDTKEEIIKKLEDKTIEEQILLNREFWINIFDPIYKTKENNFGSKYLNIIIGHTPMQNTFEESINIGIRENKYCKKVICLDTGVFTSSREYDGKLSIIEIGKDNILNIVYVNSSI
jgi:predicted phosphodiesterase